VAADNRTRANHRFKFRAIGASSSGLRNSFATRTVGDWNQLPAVVVEQESPAAFKNQLDRLAHVACRNAPPPPIGVILHDKDKTRWDRVTVWVGVRIRVGVSVRESCPYHEEPLFSCFLLL